MITSIDLSKLRNSEFLQFMTDYLGVVNLNNATTLQVKQQYSSLQAITKTIEALFKVDTSNALSDELQALDARRDAAINGMAALINGYTYHYDAATKAHATTLSNHLAIFGVGIAKNNYQSETTILRSIINDWDTQPKLTAAINTLNLASWKKELETANNAFAAKYLTRTQELGAASPESIPNKRVEAINAYYALRDRIDAFFTINDGAAPYNKAVNELNALITQYNTLLAGRQASKADTPNPEL